MDESIQLLKGMMDVAAMRHNVLADNIANANTPSFRRKDISFRETFADAIKDGRFDASKLHPEVKVDRVTPSQGNGNNVSLQTEMGAMTENSLLYGVATKAISAKYAGMRKAISGK